MTSPRLIPAGMLPEALQGLREEDVRRKGHQVGSLRWRGKIWHVEFWEWRQRDDGSLAYIQTSRSTGESNKNKARLKANEIVAQANATAHCPQGIATVSQFVESRYRADVVSHQSTSTQKLKTYLLRKHVLPTLGNVQLIEVTPALVQMLVNGKAKTGLSSQTVTHIANLIGNIFRHAKGLGFFKGDLPTEYLKLPRLVNEERQALTREQLDLFAAQLREPYRTMVLVMALTGLRVCEAAGLRWGRLNLSDQPLIVGGETLPPWSLAVREKFSHSRYSPILKSKAGKRDVLLTTESAVLLLEHAQRCRQSVCLECGIIYDLRQYRRLRTAGNWRICLCGATESWEERDPIGDEPVFYGIGGLPLDYHNAANRVIKPAARKCGLGWISFHVLRHTAETLADKAGLTVGERMRMFGQASGEMVLRYTHAESEDVRLKLEKVN